MDHQFRTVFCFCGLLVLTTGCEEAPPDRDAMSPAEYFNETQTEMHTPHGRVVHGSASDMPDGDVRYRTEEGSTFEITPIPNSQGGYRYVDPEQILQSDQ